MVKFVKIFGLLALFIQCGKNSSSFPSVTISSPKESDSFAFEDQIPVKAKLEHPRLERYRIEVAKKDGQGSFIRVNGSVSESPHHIDMHIPLEEESMEGGAYVIRITAFTNDDYASKSVPFFYIKSPKATKGLVVVYGTGGQYGFSILPYDESPIVKDGFVGDSIQSVVIKNNDQLVILPRSMGNTKIFSTKNGNEEMEVQNQSQGVGYFFTALNGTERRFTLANQLGMVQTREKTGNLLHNFTLENNFYAAFVKEGYDNLFVQQKNPGNTNSSWVIYNPRTALELGERFTNDQVVDVFTAEQNRWWVFYNHANGEGLLRWTPGGSVANYQNDFEGKILSVARLNNHRFLVLSTGGFFEVNVQQAGKIPRTQFGQGDAFAYNPDLNRMAVIDNGTLREYNMASGTLIRTLSIPQNAKYVHYYWE
ncbi:MAG: hypothetical protein JJU02_13835 [Cryomorphaceae bacterium]|nr:hypothetical protein [Cryomorphaceae bacterium]